GGLRAGCSTLNGGHYGSRNSALAARGADPRHHPHHAPLALRRNIMVTTVVDDVTTARTAVAARTGSAVSWGSIIGGAVAAAAVATILLALGSGIGLSAVSPWPGSGISATTFGMTGAVWLVITQWLSSGLGGYLSGRLRTKTVGLHTDEVFFRDTAHGFLSWALSTLIGVGLLAAAMTWAATEAARNASMVTAGTAAGVSQGASQQGMGPQDRLGYVADS